MTRQLPSSRDNGGAALNPLLADVIAAARAAWPTVDLPTEHFASYLAARLPGGGDLEDTLRRMHTSDLYLACGCALSDPNALSAFENRCLTVVDRALSRLGMGANVVSEVKQRLRRILLVDDGGPPKISEFAGRSELSRWVRVIAVHEALGIARQARRHAELDRDGLRDSVLVNEDPELDYLKRVYRREFALAFGEALQGLRDKDRLLLKQQFLDGLGVDELARLHRVHRVTVFRWLEHARTAVLSRTRAVMMTRLKIPPSELDSIMRLISSRLEVSMRLLVRRRTS
jgi:RNA polymerase sigma-70 factor (ECF subfamily)